MADEPPQRFQTRSMFSTWIGMVLLLAFFGLLALVILKASPRGSDYEEKRAAARVEKLRVLREETNKALTTYAWVDKAKGVARIPITEAMKLTVAELSQHTPAPGNPIALPESSPPPAAAASGSPSPSGTPAAAPGKSP